jgi:protein O-GlcNAc transferase
MFLGLIMKKIISFSLYGNNSVYTNGAICNAELASIIYPEWICRFYCGNSVSEEIINKLREFTNTEIIQMEENGSYSYMMWRFLPVDDSDVIVTLSRDADSRLSMREKECVDLFMESNFLFHSIQDHSCHDNVMGGMWGMKKNDRINMQKLINEWSGGLEYFSDQLFMREVIKPKFYDSTLTHCSHFLNNFPLPPNKDNFFVGEIFTDNRGKPNNYVFY